MGSVGQVTAPSLQPLCASWTPSHLWGSWCPQGRFRWALWEFQATAGGDLRQCLLEDPLETGSSLSPSGPCSRPRPPAPPGDGAPAPPRPCIVWPSGLSIPRPHRPYYGKPLWATSAEAAEEAGKDPREPPRCVSSPQPQVRWPQPAGLRCCESHCAKPQTPRTTTAGPAARLEGCIPLLALKGSGVPGSPFPRSRVGVPASCPGVFPEGWSILLYIWLPIGMLAPFFFSTQFSNPSQL